MPNYGQNGGKKIPASKIIESFRNLPDKKRIEILRANLSDNALYQIGELEFATSLGKLKSKDPETIKTYLTDNKNFGGPWQDLVPLGEDIAGAHLNSIYSRFRVPSGPGHEAEKLYALFMCNDLAQRLRVFWDGVKGSKHEEFVDSGLADIKSAEFVARYMGDQRNYAPGKGYGSFASDVMEAVDLSSEKSVMEHLNDGAPEDDPHREEKLTRAAQLCMIQNETEVDPEKIARDLKSDNWKKAVDPHAAIAELNDNPGAPYDKVKRIKTAMEEIPETDEEKAIFQNAALQTCRDIKRATPQKDREGAEFEELEKFSEELSRDIAKRELKEKSVQELRERLDGEYRTLGKEKSGWFLSKTNSKEHDAMMKGVRLLYAKLDMLNGKEPKGLTEEELKTVSETGVEKLYNNAKRGCYNYGCMKTSNGTDSIIHAAGNERFDSSMKTLSGLNELGVKLHLCEPAAAARDEAQREILQHRRDKNWLAQNVENLAAKTVYAQTLLNKGVSEAEQKKLLEDGTVNAEVEKIKANASFKDMIRTLGHKGVADAMIKGVGSLAAAYHKAHEAANILNERPSAPTLDPAEINPRESTAGLTVPTKV